MIIENSRECPSCGSNHKSKPFCVYEDGYHCFSCGVTKHSDRWLSATPTKLSATAPNLEIENCVSNFDNFSLESKAWLNKYYMTKKLVDDNTILELHENGSTWLVFPVIEYNNIVFYQKRRMRQRGFFSSGPKKIAYKQHGGFETLIIVEDFISYCRVGAFFDCVCLHGTSLTKDANYIVHSYNNIYTWLDNDHSKQSNSGQLAANKICKNLEYHLYLKSVKWGFTILNSEIKNICTEHDPKCYSDTEIKQILGV